MMMVVMIAANIFDHLLCARCYYKYFNLPVYDFKMQNPLKIKYFCNSFGKTYIDLNSFTDKLYLTDVRFFTVCLYLC